MTRAVFTRAGVERIADYALRLARSRRGQLTSATKSNGIVHTMPFWDERFAAMKAQYPDIRADQFHIDILAAHFVQKICRLEQIPEKRLTAHAIDRLSQYSWPGNVRQLENVVEMAVAHKVRQVKIKNRRRSGSSSVQ